VMELLSPQATSVWCQALSLRVLAVSSRALRCYKGLAPRQLSKLSGLSVIY